MVAATSTSDWIQGDGWREGLFEKCVNDYAPLPLPFGMEAEAGCSKSRGASKWSDDDNEGRVIMTLDQATSAAVLPSLLLDCCLTFLEPSWPVWVWGLLTPTRSTNTTAWPSTPWLLHVRISIQLSEHYYYFYAIFQWLPWPWPPSSIQSSSPRIWQTVGL